MPKVMLKIGFDFDDELGYDEITCPVDALIPSTHQYLLDFVYADLSRLETAAVDCFSGINFTNPSLGPITATPSLPRVIACLEELHPIYRRSRSTAFCVIGRAFARHIAYRLSRECKEAVDKKRFASLVKSVCHERYFSEDWLEPYLGYATQKQVASDFQMAEPIFEELNATQRDMKALIYIVFDCTNQQFAPVPIEKRAAVYCALFNSEYIPFLSVSSEMSISPPSDIRYITARIDYARPGDPEEDFYLRLMDSANQSEMSPPDELVKMMNMSMQNDEDLIIETYDTTDINELISYEIMTMVKEQVRVKRCKHCHGYFVIDKPKVEYCNRIIAGETKPCSEIGKTRVYQKKIGADEPTLLYRKAYKTRYARIKAGRLSKGEFSTWAAQASDNLMQVKSGQLGLDDYKSWLRQ